MRLILTSDLHRDGAKLLWLLDEAPAHDALLVAGDHLDIFSNAAVEEQIAGTLRWRQLVQDAGKSFAWCSGNHDFFCGEKTPMSAASPLWMKDAPSSATCVTDGESRLLKAGGENIALTTLPWPVHGGELSIDGYRTTYSDFVKNLLRLGKRLQAEEGVPWIVLCHEPPGETPLSAKYVAPEADFARRMIEAAEPDFSLHGHIHHAPNAPGGSWIWQMGKTVCFNTGQSAPNEPPHYVLFECVPGDWTAIWNGNGRVLRVGAHENQSQRPR